MKSWQSEMGERMTVREGESRARSDRFDIVIVGGGVAGSSLAIVLARSGLSVGMLERDPDPVDRVRGEFMALWGVIELKRLGLLNLLTGAGGVFSRRHIPYDENMPGEQALANALDLSRLIPEVEGAFCMGHPAMCRALAAEAERLGVVFLRGVEDVEVDEGERPAVAFTRDGLRAEWRPRLVIGADGRNSVVRRQLAMKVLADPPHNLLGGMLVDGVPEWPQDTQVIGTEERAHFLIFPQGGDRIRLYLCYDFADKALYSGADRQQRLIDMFARLRCLPQAGMIAACRPIGPFNSFSNEDRWVEDPTAPGVVLIGDAAGYNDPITGQGLSIALRDVRLVSEIVLAGGYDRESFRPYVEERLERMRRLRIAARLAAVLRAEFGEEARQRRQLVLRRILVDKMPGPSAATLIGPDKLPAVNFEQATLDALLSPSTVH
jgi:2-polyprenyl-6-methoxyphenol hydroxylase-like FAD-dependent oxidoreductase